MIPVAASSVRAPTAYYAAISEDPEQRALYEEDNPAMVTIHESVATIYLRSGHEDWAVRERMRPGAGFLIEGLRVLGDWRNLLFGARIVLAMNVRPRGLLDAGSRRRHRVRTAPHPVTQPRPAGSTASTAVPSPSLR